MSNYSDDGLDYIFGKMGAIYGATFTRHWEGVDHNLVRSVWADEIGGYLSNKPSLDYALRNMNPDFPPSAIAFSKLCQSGPRITMDEPLQIAKQYTEEQRVQIKADKEKAIAKLKELSQMWKNPPAWLKGE